jgi:hypothetical protein
MIISFIQRKIQVARVKAGIREADEKKLITGRRQYLIRLNNGRLRVVDKRYVYAYNKLNKTKMTSLDLVKMSLYNTK